ncbi:MAG: N(2)-fixation sustaining protein CowN [Campylobacterales bacterium]
MHDVDRVNQRYVSFESIDCFSNAIAVIDLMVETKKNPENDNLYWKKIRSELPQSYYKRDPKEDKKEELLYFVCSKVFYLEELFEDAECQEGLDALKKCELECC